MFSPGAKLRQSVQSAGEAVRRAAEGTGRLAAAALVIACTALLAFVFLAWKVRLA